MITQGYLILAFGPKRYRDMACACAASLRHWDKTRKIQIVTDCPDFSGEPEAKLFDIITVSKPNPKYQGPLVKLLMHDFSVFDETMFIDADCFMLKSDIDRYWSEMSALDVSTPGAWSSSGLWYKMDVQKICDLVNVERIVKMNSGVMFFKKTRKSYEFFELAKNTYSEFGNFTSHIHRDLGPPDEPYFGIAFGKLNIDPFWKRDSSGNAWMSSTIGATDFNLSAFSGAPSYMKNGFVSPTICHFVGLLPKDQYTAIKKEFMQTSGVKLTYQRQIQDFIQSYEYRKLLSRITSRLKPS